MLCLAVIPGQAIQLLPLHWGVFALLAADYLQRLVKSVRFGVPLFHCLGRDLFGILVLPYEAVMMVDAIIRTLYRMKISHRRLFGMADRLRRRKTSAKYIVARLAKDGTGAASCPGRACSLLVKSPGWSGLDGSPYPSFGSRHRFGCI